MVWIAGAWGRGPPKATCLTILCISDVQSSWGVDAHCAANCSLQCRWAMGQGSIEQPSRRSANLKITQHLATTHTTPAAAEAAAVVSIIASTTAAPRSDSCQAVPPAGAQVMAHTG